MVLSCFVIFASGAQAQTDSGLAAAISGGPPAIKSFYATYANNPSGLAALDPNLVATSIAPANGGISNMTDVMTGSQINDYFEEVMDNASTATEAIMIKEAIEDMVVNGVGASLADLPADVLIAIETLAPGSLADLAASVPDLFTTILKGSEIMDLLDALPSDIISDILSYFFTGTDLGALGDAISSMGFGGLLSQGSFEGTSSPLNDMCDPKIMDTMKTRGWLEAQREITSNQNIISKPDSVLEYTCFDRMLGVIGQGASDLFSENSSVWSGGGMSSITSSDMNGALQDVVMISIKQYLGNNFNHTYLGGRSNLNNTSITSAVPDSDYACTQMENIWKFAKCVNFSNEPEDGFYTFQQIADQNIRRYPNGACSNPETRWQSNIDATYAGAAWKPTYQANLNSSYSKLATYTKPADCSASRIIKTGIPVKVQGANWTDAVCINMGCYYDGSTCTAF